MTERFATTPFGGGRISAAQIRHREAISRRQSELGDGNRQTGNDTGRAEKWQLVRALTEARAAFGLSDRSIAVLDALLSFHPERELDGSRPIIVFPSNTELSLRSRGMADATLRRHLAALVEAGLILRRDSPNGKRYCRRDERGEVESAFGFDLSPLALAAAAIHEAAEAARAQERLCRRLRGEITIHQRDIAKLVEAAREEERKGDWEGFAMALLPLCRRMARTVSPQPLEQRCAALVRLRAEVETAYLNSLSKVEMSANDLDSERQYQNSKTEPPFEYSSEKELKPGNWPLEERQDDSLDDEPGAAAEAEGRQPLARAPETKSQPVPLAYLLRVCPTLASYSRSGIADWGDVLQTATLVRSMLGISPDAWNGACETMGKLAASVVIAAILERSEAIRSPGGYLRALTGRAGQGKFSLLPMLSALERAGEGSDRDDGR